MYVCICLRGPPNRVHADSVRQNSTPEIKAVYWVPNKTTTCSSVALQLTPSACSYPTAVARCLTMPFIHSCPLIASTPLMPLVDTVLMQDPSQSAVIDAKEQLKGREKLEVGLCGSHRLKSHWAY